MKQYSTLFMLVIFLGIGCGSPDQKKGAQQQSDSLTAHVQTDLKEIKERGVLRAITSYSATSYFMYRGQPLGYEYELVERLANSLGVDLEVVVADNMDEIFKMLLQGKGDIIAYGMTVTQDRKKIVDFTEHHLTTRQVLVQKKPDNWRKIPKHKTEQQLIRNQIDLIGKTIHVRKNSSYYQRLQNLEEEIGGQIDIQTVPGDVETEQLVRKVAEGEIKYTVADQNIAMINQTYLPNIDIETPVSFPQRIAWAVRKNAPDLLEYANQWISRMKKTTDYYVIYNKYFKNKKAFQARIKSEFYSKTGDKISQFDRYIQKYAQDIGWDWRLLASQVYQESRFQPNAQSWAGAKGLMQIMPGTARDLGIQNLNDPALSIKAGVKYLKQLQERWEGEIKDTLERIKFTMASYNVGKGHIEDARRLAKKYGKNPNVWEGHVAEFILQKSNPKYYNDEVVKYGYCRGKEPFHYVKQIFQRYQHYKKFIPRQTEPGSS